MNKQELLEAIDKLIEDAEHYIITAKNVKDDINQSFYLGKKNGLLWAKMYISNLDDLNGGKQHD